MRIVNYPDDQKVNNWKTPLENYACSIRPMAVVMVTKIAGFESISGKDQEAASLLLSKSHKLQEYYAEQYGSSRLLKMGDIIIASFCSAERAVECALRIQSSAHKMFNHKLRIGIHMGEVRYGENDLFGGPLKVASHLQEMAKSGHILVSEAIVGSLEPEKYAIGLYRTDKCEGMGIRVLNPSAFRSFYLKIPQQWQKSRCR